MSITSTQRGSSVDSNPGTSQKILSEIKNKQTKAHENWMEIHLHS